MEQASLGLSLPFTDSVPSFTGDPLLRSLAVRLQEGDGTALYITEHLTAPGVTVTRLARGLASGMVLEFANREMLADALANRRSV